MLSTIAIFLLSVMLMTLIVISYSSDIVDTGLTTLSLFPHFLICFVYALLVVNLFQMECLLFLIVIACVFLFFSPYFSSPSRLHLKKTSISVEENFQYRRHTEAVVYTNFIYLLCGFISVIYKQYYLALFQFLTFIGSYLYHMHREKYYFNVDNVFALSLMCFFALSVFISYYKCIEYFIVGTCLSPLAMFLIVDCGMPADIRYDKLFTCCYRYGRPKYDNIHGRWHLVSGFFTTYELFILPLLCFYIIQSAKRH